MFDRWKEARVSRAKELDLIPIMNLMVTLIPFLMLGAAFYHLGVVPISLPTQVDQPTVKDKPEVVVTLNLLIDRQRMVLSGSSAQLEQPVLDALRAELPNRGGDYDVSGLKDRLVAIKAQYPKSDTIVVFPEDTVRYQSLVAILDQTRERTQGTEAGEPVKSPLFPVTVFSRPPIPEPAPPPEEAPPEEAPTP